MLRESNGLSESFSGQNPSYYPTQRPNHGSTRCGRAWKCLCPGAFNRNLSNKIKVLSGATLAAVGVGCIVGFSAEQSGMESEQAVIAGVVSGIASGVFAGIALRMRSLRAGEGVLGRGDEDFCTLLRNSFHANRPQRGLLDLGDPYPLSDEGESIVL